MTKVSRQHLERHDQLAYRSLIIKSLIKTAEHPITKEALEKELARNAEMMTDAMAEAIRQAEAEEGQWTPKRRSLSELLRTGPSIMEIVNNVPRVVISNMSFGEALAKELEQAGKATCLATPCDECERREGCQPSPKGFETSITIDTKAASVDELWDAVVNLQVELFRRGAKPQ